MARTTVLNTIERIRRQLSSAQRGEIYTLNEALDTTETSVDITPTPSPGLAAGSDITIGLERMRVTFVAAATLDVFRGWLDSDGATHAAGDVVWANPRFSTLDIYDAMIDEIRSWGPHLYRTVGTETTTADDDETIEAPATVADAYGVISAHRQWSADYLPAGSWPALEFRLQRGTTSWTPATTSGLLLRLTDPVAAGSVFIMWAVPFNMTVFDLTTDLVATVGLAESMLDVLSMGVRLRLLADDDAASTGRDVQDEPRRAEETPVGSGVQMHAQMFAIYQRRKGEEINKLRTRYPYRAG